MLTDYNISYVVAHGTLTSGHDFYGPFDTAEQAQFWIDNKARWFSTNCRLVPVEVVGVKPLPSEDLRPEEA